MDKKRTNISSGSKFEQAYGYSRAVKVGDTLYISGTIGMNFRTGEISPDPVEQTRQVIANIELALTEAGGSLKDLVQTTLYITSADVFQTIGPELGRILGDIRPTMAALVVQFPVPDAKVEIAATAVLGCES